MQFEWDDAKAALNLAKHGVDFETAKMAFSDPNRLERYRPQGREDRFFMIGAAGDLLLAIAYAEREAEGVTDSIIRIISARKADKDERKVYRRR